MNLLLYIAFILMSAEPPVCDMAEVRNQFHKENDSESRLENHISYLESMTCVEVTPYLACAIMQQAEHSSWPISQLGYFNEGKDMLEEYIANYPNDIEARYVRYLIQKESPSFLGYQDNISEDRLFIKDRISSANLPASLVDKMKTAIN